MRLKNLALFTASALGLALLGLSVLWKPDPRLVYNPSPSAPIGWYRIDPGAEISAGMLVASSLTDEAERLADGRRYLPRGTPVIKTVWAVPGDAYCVREDSLTVRETDFSLALEDSSGRELPRLEPGCRTVAEGHVLLLSDTISTSFDSRYFGEVPLSLVIGEAVYLGRDRSGKVGDGAGARAWGAQGKIKGPSAAGGSGRCLHISFKGAAETSAALRSDLFLSEISALAQCHFTPFHPTSCDS